MLPTKEEAGSELTLLEAITRAGNLKPTDPRLATVGDARGQIRAYIYTLAGLDPETGVPAQKLRPTPTPTAILTYGANTPKACEKTARAESDDDDSEEDEPTPRASRAASPTGKPKKRGRNDDDDGVASESDPRANEIFVEKIVEGDPREGGSSWSAATGSGLGHFIGRMVATFYTGAGGERLLCRPKARKLAGNYCYGKIVLYSENVEGNRDDDQFVILYDDGERRSLSFQEVLEGICLRTEHAHAAGRARGTDAGSVPSVLGGRVFIDTK